MALWPRVEVSMRKWLRDSHGLYDFEASGANVEATSFSMRSSGALCRHGDRLEPLEESAASSSRRPPVLQCRPCSAGVQVSATLAPGRSLAPWVVVKDLPLPQRIDKGDTLMLGRATLDISQVVTDQSSLAQPAVFGQTCCLAEDASQSDAVQCRICLMDGTSEEDPFVKPCSCRGSIESVHLGCLRRWAKTRMNLPEAGAAGYSFRQPCCEMCKSDYPAWVQRGQHREPLLDLPAVDGPFLVLQSLVKGSKSHGREQQVTHHVLSFAGTNLAKIGRGRECPLMLHEVTLSRWHASIRFENGAFHIEDHESKFGTLLAMRQPWTLAPSQPISVKVGCMLLSLALPASDSASECCLSTGRHSLTTRCDGGEYEESSDDAHSVGKL